MAVFPGALVDPLVGNPLGLGLQVDQFLALFTAPSVPTDTTWFVDTTLGLPTAGYLVSGNNIVTYSGKTSNSFTGITHVKNPMSHTVGSKVRQAPVAANLNHLVQELIAMQTKLGVGTWQNYVSAREFGAYGDFSHNDTSALNAAVSYVMTNGGILFIPAGNYLTTGPITGGSGGSDDTAGVRPSFAILGAGSGPDNGNFFGRTCITYQGSPGVSALLDIYGAERFGLSKIDFHGAGSAARVVRLRNVSYGEIIDVSARHPAVNGASWTVDKVNQTQFSIIRATAQAANASGMKIGTDTAFDSSSNSQNKFSTMTLEHQGDTLTSHGLWIRFADNNSFDRVTTLPVSLDPGFGCFFEIPSGLPGFPGELLFENCAFIGGVGGQCGSGGVKFDPYPTSDAEGIPNIPYATFVTYDHRDYGYGDGDENAMTIRGSRLRADVIPDRSQAVVSHSLKISNTAANTDFYSRTMDWSRVKVGDLLNFRVTGLFDSVAGTCQFTLRIRLDGNIIWSGSFTPPITTDGFWEITGVGRVLSVGPTGTMQRLPGYIRHTGQTAPISVGNVTLIDTWDFTTTKTLVPRITMSIANAGNTMTHIDSDFWIQPRDIVS